MYEDTLKPFGWGRSAFPNEPSGDGLWQGRTLSLPTLAMLIGPCVYAIRTDDDLIKIGHTRNLAHRRPFQDELHRQFHPHLARGREYYHPDPEIMEYINDIRERLGVAAI